MTRILLLSDTHGYMGPEIIKHAKASDQIWHAGDIGSLAVLEALEAIKPVKAVYGNIDDHTLRSAAPQDCVFKCEDVKVYMTHIGGYPGRYNGRVKNIIQAEKPKLFICGHSHILKVMSDKEHGLLHMNPGAIGKPGFHKVRTMLRFIIDGDYIADLEVIEFSR